MNGREDTALDYLQGQRRRLIVMKQWKALLEDFDVMIGLGGATNSTGHPAVGKLFGDDMVLSVAHAYQVAHDYHTHKPPQFG